MCGPILCSSEKSWELEGSFLAIWHHAKSRVSSENISVFPTHFNVDISLVTEHVGVMQLVSRILSEGVVPYVAVQADHPLEEGNFGAFCDLEKQC